jgi:hypothetical protein
MDASLTNCLGFLPGRPFAGVAAEAMVGCTSGAVQCHEHLGGLLRYYRSAA